MTEVNQFVGTWRLHSCEAKSARGDIERVYGENPFGRLMYGADGRMSVLISQADLQVGKAIVCATPDTFTGFLAYCGTFRIDFHSQTVIHTVEWCNIQSWNGSDQVRLFTLDKNVLTIDTAPYERNRQEWVSSLIWRKL